MFVHNDADKQRLLENYQLCYNSWPLFFEYPSLADDAEQNYYLPYPIQDCLRYLPHDILFSYDNYRPLNPNDYDPKQHPFCLIFVPCSDDLNAYSVTERFYVCNQADLPLNINLVHRYYREGDTIPCERAYRLSYPFEEPDMYSYILRPTAAHLKTLQQPKVATELPTYLTTPAMEIQSGPKSPITLIKTDYTLNLHYQQAQQSDLIDQKYMYYRVIDSNDQHHLGLLNLNGKDTIKNLPLGAVKVYYGLQRADASDKGITALNKQHQQLVTQLKQSLDAIIANTKHRADQQNAALQKKGLWGKGWVYTEVFATAFAENTATLAKTTLENLTSPTTVLDTLASTMMQCLAEGNINPIKQQYQQLKIKVTTTEKDFDTLGRLLTDADCLELLINFPNRYLETESSLDKTQMLGQLAPTLLMTLITGGDSALIKGGAKASSLIDSIAGKEGTIARLQAQATDTGEVVGETSELTTVKRRQTAAQNSVNALKLKAILAFQENGILDENEQLTTYAIKDSKIAMSEKSKLTKKTVIKELTRDGSNINDWEKRKTPTIIMPNGQRLQIHYYENTVTNAINYNIDYKIKGIVNLLK